MKIVIVTPAKNEAAHIKILLTELRRFKLDIIVVDDESSDGTTTIAKKYTPYVLTHMINLGKGSALKTGCDFAFDHLNADAVILMDSDGQHSPKEIPHFCKKLKNGAHLVLGIRSFQKEMPLLKRFLNTSLSLLMKLVYGTFIPDIPSGYKAFTKETYGLILWKGNGYEVEMEIAVKIAQLGLPYFSVPIRTIYNRKSRGMTLEDALHSFFRILISKFDIQKL